MAGKDGKARVDVLMILVMILQVCSRWCGNGGIVAALVLLRSTPFPFPASGIVRNHPVAGAADGDLCQLVQFVFGMVEHAQQHRQG